MNGRPPLPDITVRPVAPADEDRIVRFLAGLSDQTVYRRFFTLFPTPPRRVVALLARVSDDDHVELVALDGDEIVAVASWDRTGPASDEAELAVVVDDAWQHRGLGRALMRMVSAEATQHGIRGLVATVLSENQPARRLARSLRPPEEVTFDGPMTTYTFRVAS